MMNYTKNQQQETKTILKVTYLSLFCVIGLAICKFIVGTFAKSHALLADAVHSFSDSTTDLAIIIGVRYWTKPADDDHPHGHYRIETFVTAIIGLSMIVIATWILKDAITILNSHDKQPLPGNSAVYMAVISIIIQELLYQITIHIGTKIKSEPLIANAWHHRSDALSSIPVLLALIAASVNPSLVFLDNVAAIAVSLFIYQTSYKILSPSLSKLLDKGVSQDDIKKIKNTVSSIGGVKNVHNIRTRYIGSHRISIDCHIEVDADISVREGHWISEVVHNALLEKHENIVDAVIHIEPYEAKFRVN